MINMERPSLLRKCSKSGTISVIQFLCRTRNRPITRYPSASRWQRSILGDTQPGTNNGYVDQNSYVIWNLYILK